LELTKKTPPIESLTLSWDILAVLDGELALGEAKKGNRLGSTAAAEKRKFRNTVASPKNSSQRSSYSRRSLIRGLVETIKKSKPQLLIFRLT